MFPHHALPGHNLLWTCLRLPGGTGAYNIYVHGYALAHTLGWAFLLVIIIIKAASSIYRALAPPTNQEGALLALASLALTLLT